MLMEIELGKFVNFNKYLCVSPYVLEPIFGILILSRYIVTSRVLIGSILWSSSDIGWLHFLD